MENAQKRSLDGHRIGICRKINSFPYDNEQKYKLTAGSLVTVDIPFTVLQIKYQTFELGNSRFELEILLAKYKNSRFQFL